MMLAVLARMLLSRHHSVGDAEVADTKLYHRGGAEVIVVHGASECNV